MKAAHSPSAAHILRTRARTSLDGKWGLAVGVTLLALMLGGAATFPLTLDTTEWELHLWDLPPLLFELFKELVTSMIRDIGKFFTTAAAMIWGLFFLFWKSPIEFFREISPLLWNCVRASLPLWAIWFFVGSSIRLGLARFRLQLLDGQAPSSKTLFYAFKEDYFKALWLRVLRCLIILAWSLLFIVPGIIAAYRYAMADYALSENPAMSVTDALRESARMMRGNKWKLFCLRLSFIGWHLLCGLTLGIGELWLNPYIGQAEVAFYDEASGRAKVREMLEEIAEVGI